MLKINNWYKIVGMSANGHRINKVEYDDSRMAHVFGLSIKTPTNEVMDISVYLLGNGEPYPLFVMGYRNQTEISITKQDVKDPIRLALQIRVILQKLEKCIK